jgi:hypothetical protein
LAREASLFPSGSDGRLNYLRALSLFLRHFYRSWRSLWIIVDNC